MEIPALVRQVDFTEVGEIHGWNGSFQSIGLLGQVSSNQFTLVLCCI